MMRFREAVGVRGGIGNRFFDPTWQTPFGTAQKPNKQDFLFPRSFALPPSKQDKRADFLGAECSWGGGTRHYFWHSIKWKACFLKSVQHCGTPIFRPVFADLHDVPVDGCSDGDRLQEWSARRNSCVRRSRRLIVSTASFRITSCFAGRSLIRWADKCFCLNLI